MSFTKLAVHNVLQRH